MSACECVSTGRRWRKVATHTLIDILSVCVCARARGLGERARVFRARGGGGGRDGKRVAVLLSRFTYAKSSSLVASVRHAHEHTHTPRHATPLSNDHHIREGDHPFREGMSRIDLHHSYTSWTYCSMVGFTNSLLMLFGGAFPYNAIHLVHAHTHTSTHTHTPEPIAYTPTPTPWFAYTWCSSHK